jgi:ectoine hydroxylase-related dioxygenase (phytanoyl-CoA dioxygenase family)
MFSAGQLDDTEYARSGFTLIRQMITTDQSDRLMEDCLKAVRGEVFVPTWREYAATRTQEPLRESPRDRRGEDLFMQLAHPSDCEALRHWRLHACYEQAFTVARALCPERGLRFSYDQCFYKPAGSDAVVYPHQDAAYWRVVGTTCWIALTEVNIQMAPVEYYAGTHDRLLPHVLAPVAWNQVRDFTVHPHVMSHVSSKPIAYSLRPGDAVFHSSLTIHGSGPNRGSRARCGLALHFKTDVPVI